MKYLFKQKNMYKLFFTFLAIFFTIALHAQNNAYDPEAKKILDAVSLKTKNAQPFSVAFSNRLIDKQSEVDETTEGKLVVSGAKYKLELGSNILFCDGKSIYTYYPELDEAELRNIEDMDEAMNPALVFDMYKKGFKYKLRGEETIAGKKFHVIDLYPEKANDKPYSRAQLMVNKTTNELYSFSTYFKDGKQFTLTLKEFKSKIAVNEQDFVFDPKKYPNVEITDLR